MSDVFLLSRAQMRRIEPFFPSPRGRPRVNDRRVLSGIIYVIRHGLRWRDAPRAYGPHKTLYNRFVRWAAEGVWQAVFEALVGAESPPEQVLLDSTHIKAHRCAAGGKGGARRRRSGSAAVDAPASSTP